MTVPISGGNTKRQIMLMQDFGTTILACTPSYALYLAETMEEMNIDRSSLKLKAGVFGAEPWTEAMRGEIEQRLGILAIDIYGLSEIMGPGVASECEYQQGLHIAEDFFLAEIIDPETLEPLPYGEGRAVITTIDKDGIPLSATARATSPRCIRKPAAAAARCAHGKCWAAATTCSSSAASTYSRRRLRACW